MAIVEIKNNDELYFILTKIPKVIICFYTVYQAEYVNARKYNAAYIKESRKSQNRGITFCKVNCDELPDIQLLYDIELAKAPCTLFLKNAKIIKKFYGNKPELLDDYTTDFAHL